MVLPAVGQPVYGAAPKSESLEDAEKARQERQDDLKPAPRQDEFKHADIAEGENPAGLYQIPKGEKKAEEPSDSPEQTPEAEKKSMGKSTIDDSEVRREIEKLKRERAELQQRIQKSGEEEKAELEQRLKQVEMELKIKDNDAYIKQHAKKSYTEID